MPFKDWLYQLDETIRGRIRARLTRVEAGHFGDYKTVGDGPYELRLMFGAGYRIYFGQVGKLVVLLLLGGNKKTQVQDIRKSKEYWIDFRRRTHETQSFLP
jgi:putative addiction module killer protein